MRKPIVAIVGRPNVGKSTLFNKIAKKRVSIVDDLPGVTRDRLYWDAEWLGHEFTMIDTGGIEVDSNDFIMASVRRQAALAIEEADVILFVVDSKTGITTADEEVAALLRHANKPVILAVNKVDSIKDSEAVYEFYGLGLGEPLAVSAANLLNLGDLLDAVVAEFPPEQEAEEQDDRIKIAVIGRPNVGKSSLVNGLLGQERVIVSDIPGTTRDAIDTVLEKDGVSYVLIDTAGMRKKAKIEDESIERYSVVRSLSAVERADVVLMVLDAVDRVTEQDKKIAGYAHEAGKSLIIVVNKWDLVEKDSKTTLEYTQEIRNELAFMQYAPVLFISALTKQRVHRVLELVNYVAEQRSMRIATNVLNQVISDAVSINPTPSDKGKRLKIYYATQSGVNPPTIVFFVNDPEVMHFSYLRFLENKLRESFGFEGSPLRLVVRGKKDKEE
ncbi:ribosome biogenesis GTPase Der [Acetonema longum]|uniref:GTPase Der n=1 Tax=Acetonema longum DSM 6540 TaxID=1009370 RepID=F7NGB8_9FIRM|nr:ribosome biogenesis GTPase Der [Acetonema longum]EGO64911.1 GTP-binding protein Der [Acetonema longum DSM 6540]